MSSRESYLPGVPCWVATVQPDPEAAARFYGGLFGWETENLMPTQSPGDYFLCRLRGRDVAAVVSEHGAPPPPAPTWSTFVCVRSADEAAAAAAEAGGEVVGDPVDSPGGGRMAVLSDPVGAVFCVWQPEGRQGAQLVNEPGAWAMSQLMTRDPDPAKDFYGSVFGWQTETFDAGEGGPVVLWRLPGYVGGEPEQPVPRDVVAVMTPMAGDAPAGAPAHWSVDFWVDDVDAAADKAADTGGSVVAPAFDTPVGRTAVLADPAGASFSVSKVTARR